MRGQGVCAHVIQQCLCVFLTELVSVFVSVCAGAFGLPEGSLCAGVSLERQMSGTDILGQPGSGQSFI